MASSPRGVFPRVVEKRGGALTGEMELEERMRVVVQRVTEARVRVGEGVVGEVGRGLLVLVGFGPDDERDTMLWMADKLWGLRIFPDESGRMNRSVTDVGGAMLIVSQFTLYGDASRGRRPSFASAAPPDEAERMYREFVEICGRGGVVAEGRFGAMMEVELVNDGPVTLLVER